MTSVEFLDEAWSEYISWQAEDRKTLKRINNLIQSNQRDGLESGLENQNAWNITMAGHGELTVKIA